ncbi:LysM peptidoglycan-binding domain-containing protein, partial [Lactiplantibacillus plantarum]|uniref:LysM peptidoglycan-binding domain-containing protein n=1 Tax=Lactiplantibacillus plantarum TaxID=1590 RepID=UPI00189AACEE
VGGNMTNAKAMMAYYLPRVKTPKGSIVALDYEDGASTSVTANTNVIKAQFKLIIAAGYTPMLYGGKDYLSAHVNVSAIVKAYGNCLWLAEYPDYLVRTKPDYNWFPSMDGVAIFQFTSMYRITGYVNGVPQGLDGNVDLTGITKSGYGNQPVNPTPQPQPHAKWVKETKTYTLKTAVKLRTGASTSANVMTTLPAGTTVKTDQAIIQGGYRWVRQPRSNGCAYLATGPASNTLEYVKSGATHTYYTVKSGDSWWTIAQRNGLSMTALASQNGKSIYTTIYPGQRLVVR